MPLLKRRPEIAAFTPRLARPGEELSVRVALTCVEAVPVDYVDVELRGTYVAFDSAHPGVSAETEGFLCQRARVFAGGELAAGERAWAVAFALPHDAPPSYSGATFRVDYTLHVHASVPWWPDARAVFVIQVGGVGGALPAPRPPPPARVFAPDAAGARGTDPFFELSLASLTVAGGESLSGALALANTGHHDYREAHFTLVAVESSRRLLGRRTHHRPLCAWKLPTAGLRDGAPLRFRFELPEGLCPGFDRGTYALEWYLEARVTIPWSRDPRVWLPLEVVAPSAALPLDGDAPAPLAVGTERVDLLWRSLAEQSGLTFDGGAIVGRAGDAALRIAREPRGRRGTVVGARVDLLDLDLGLGLELHHGRLRGRDPAQVTWLEGQLGDLLARRPPTAVSDRGLALELDDPGQVAAALRPFIDDVKALALLLDTCRDRAPPPTAMSAHVAAWERAAAHLGGRLRRGPMAIVSRSDDLDVELRSEWDEHGRPLRAVLEARAPAAIDGRHHLRWEARSGGPPSSELALDGLWPGARALEIDEAGVRVILDGPLADPLRELGRIAALIELSGRLQGRRGAYR